MLNTLNYAKPAFEATAAAWESTRYITGTCLGHRLSHLNAAQRGIVGGGLHTGALTLVRATLEQAAYLAHTSTTYARAGAKLTAGEQSLVWDGALPLLAPKPVKHVASDDEVLVAIVARIGVDRALELIVQADQVAVAA